MECLATRVGGLALVLLLWACVCVERGSQSSILDIGSNINHTLESNTRADFNSHLNPDTEPQPSPPPRPPPTSKELDVSRCGLWSCRERCVGGGVSPNQSCYSCQCDNLCVAAGDCCQDYFSRCHNTSDPGLAASHIRRLLDSTAPSTPGEAAPHPTALLAGYGQCTHTSWNSFWAVHSCPALFADLGIKSRCEGTSAVLAPVSHVDHPALVFRNVFCAQCHGLGRNHTTPWPLVLKCDNIKTDPPTVEEIMQAFKGDRCKKIYQPPLIASKKGNTSFQAAPRLCHLPEWDQQVLQSALNASVLNATCSENESLFCLAYNFPTNINSPVSPLAKNAYCLKCGINYHFSNSCGSCTGNINSNTDSVMAGPGFTGITKLFHFSSDGSEVDIDGQAVAWPGFFCGEDEVYDHDEKVCRTITCFTGYRLQAGQCVLVSTLVDGHSQLLPTGARFLSVVVLWADTADPDSVTEMKNELTEQLKFFRLPSSELTFLHSADNRRLQISMNVTREFIFTKLYRDSKTLHTSIAEATRGVVSITFSNVRSELDDLTTGCPDGASPVTVHEANVTEENEALFVVVTDQGVQQLYPLENLPLNLVLFFGSKDQDPGPVVIHAVLCKQNVSNSSLSCPAQQHLSNETSLVNGSLLIRHSGLVFGEGEYEIDGDVVRVCSRYKNRNSLWERLVLVNFNPAQKIVMHVISAFSVLSLVFVLSVYCLLPELRTLPGKFIICLVACLILGHLTLNVDVQDDTACRVLGVLSHGVWLACFTWMSAMAVHMASTFTCMSYSLPSRQAARRRWLVYSLVCWGLPLGAVLLCVTLDALPSRPLTMDYGKVCGWIGNGPANVWAFLVPVAVSMAVNLAAFLATVVGLERTARMSSLAREGRSEGRRLVVYVKMSAALGFTWMLGVGAALASSAWLQWVYVLLNSLQGTFLALAFLKNERVATMIRNKMATVCKREFSSPAVPSQTTATPTKSTSNMTL